MKRRLIWKLLAINVPIVAIVILVIWLAVDYLAADYFTVLMEMYDISPAEAHQMFVDAVHRYVIETSLLALAAASLCSFLLVRRILRPLSHMAKATKSIADGDYSARVEVVSNDEVGELGMAFNQMSDSLERMERLRRQMVVDIAHELRTPLTNIRGYFEGLQDGVVSPSKQTYAVLKEEINRLVGLVEDLQQLTKADVAWIRLHRENVFLPDLVAHALELYKHQFQSRGISVETRFDPRAEYVRADHDKLFQAIRNLVQNASQYTPVQGRVTVSTERLASEVKLSVANTGQDIDQADLPFIFERFYRADKSRSRVSGGSGIGLAIVKELIEAHGGKVRAESNRDQTLFWFTLPA
jgi:signal transduction histidine kinase